MIINHSTCNYNIGMYMEWFKQGVYKSNLDFTGNYIFLYIVNVIIYTIHLFDEMESLGCRMLVIVMVKEL